MNLYSWIFIIFIDKTWSLEHSLPLHLCGLMWFMCIYLFITKKQWVFEMILFIGMPGGIHSLLTPELPHGADLLHKVDFFIGHGGLILAPFYAISFWECGQEKMRGGDRLLNCKY